MVGGEEKSCVSDLYISQGARTLVAPVKTRVHHLCTRPITYASAGTDKVHTDTRETRAHTPEGSGKRGFGVKKREILGTQFYKTLNRPTRRRFNAAAGRLAVISKTFINYKWKLLRCTTITTTTATATTTTTTITMTTATTTITITTATTITTIITTYRYLYIYNCVVWSGTLWYNRLVLTPYWNWDEFNEKEKKSCNIAIVKDCRGHAGAVARRTSCVFSGYFRYGRERAGKANERMVITFLLNFSEILVAPGQLIRFRAGGVSRVTIEFRAARSAECDDSTTNANHHRRRLCGRGLTFTHARGVGDRWRRDRAATA